METSSAGPTPISNEELYLAVSKLILFCLASAIAAQAQTGAVKSAGQPIPGATVTATLNGERFAVVTGADGRFQLPHIAAGQGTITVRMFGFEPVSREAALGDGAPAIDFSLRLLEADHSERASTTGSPLQSEIESSGPPAGEP